MKWNYRIVRKKHDYRDPSTQEECTTYTYEIHEAYYNEDGRVCMITENAVRPFGETIEELRHDWIMMSEAFGKPILEYDKIPEPGCKDAIKARDGDTHERGSLEEDRSRIIGEAIRTQDDAEYYAEREDERLRCERQHEQKFVGSDSLKSLIEKLYEDYMASKEPSC